MAQKSITSFFTKAPPKLVSAVTNVSTPVREKSVSSDEDSPVKLKKKPSKRPRIDSDSDSQSLSPKKKNIESSPKSGKKTPESSPSSEKKTPLTSPPSAKKTPETSPPSEKKTPETSPPSAKKTPETSPTSAKKNSVLKVKIVSNKKTAVKKTKEPKNSKKNSKTSNVKTEQSDSEEISKENKTTNQDKTETKSEIKKETKTKSETETKKNINSFFLNKSNDSKPDDNKSIEYDPTKPKYHPIKDAIWKENEKVPYLALTRTLEEIEKISARLKIIDTLSNYFRSVIALSPEDLLPSIYLCLNKLAPAYEGVELGIAENNLMKAIAQSTGRSMAQLKSECNACGDLGVVAEQSRSNQRMMFRPAALTVRTVYDKLKEVAQMTGHAVMSKKIDKIQTLFVACRHSEAKFLIRSLAGKLRIGLAEQSVLQALAQACSLTPPRIGDEELILDGSKGLSTEQFKGIVDEQALTLKTAYCECPNYDLIVPVILKHGVMELPLHCKLTPGIPLKPMLAHPTKGVSEVLSRFENLKFTCEWKYDGERAQIHLPSIEKDGVEMADIAKASIYSRNLENNTSKYPDILARLKNAIKDSVKSCIMDCEAVAWDKEKKQILPFQILSTRKRKDAKESDIKVAVCLYMFDLLYLNGESLVKIPFEERRKLLKEHFIETEGEWHFATSLDCSTTEDIQEFLEESIRGNCEGLMVKTLGGKDATYEIAKRSRNWLKLKKDYIEGIGDTIDAVVLGGYLGRGKRTGVYGGFLLACYDKDSEEYQTLCKIGTGFSDEDLQTHSKSLKEHLIESPRNYYRYDSSLEPDHWFAPAQVWEIKCGDLSLSPIHKAAVGIVDPEKGISLRFPRFIRMRDDKTAEEATSAHQIAELYSNQDQVKNQANNIKLVEEDFY